MKKVFSLLAIMFFLSALILEGNVKALSLVETNDILLQYRGHVQDIGWQNWTSNDTISGTIGKSARLEGINIKIQNGPGNIKIRYSAHVQNIGWQAWKQNGELAGTSGQSLRIEALKIQLINAPAGYHIQYSAYVQNIGWQDWKQDGALAGTTGKALRLEALKIRIVKENSTNKNSPTNIKNVNNTKTTTQKVTNIKLNKTKTILKAGAKDTNVKALSLVETNDILLQYRGHVQDIGWQNWTSNDTISGTIGKSARLEGINIKIQNGPGNIKIRYSAHVQNIGWQAWKQNGELAGTSGQSLRIEALKIQLINAPAGYHIQYSAYVQDIGWQDWKQDGDVAGTTGKALRLEALKIRIVKENSTNENSSTNIKNVNNTKTTTQKVTNIKLNKTKTILKAGAKDTLSLTISPSNATNKAVTWKSSNPKVAKVVNGVLTAVSSGTATITATTVDGNKTANCIVTVPKENKPIIKINSPALDEGIISYKETENGLLPINATASKNVNYMSIEIDRKPGKKPVKVSRNGSISFNWNTKGQSAGKHEIIIKAKNTAGVVSEQKISVYLSPIAGSSKEAIRDWSFIYNKNNLTLEAVINPNLQYKIASNSKNEDTFSLVIIDNTDSNKILYSGDTYTRIYSPTDSNYVIPSKSSYKGKYYRKFNLKNIPGFVVGHSYTIGLKIKGLPDDQWKTKQQYITISASTSPLTVYSKYDMSLESILNIQMEKSPQTQKNGLWVNASKDEVANYLNPNNYNEGINKYQFLDLSSSAGISEQAMNDFLSNKGILAGKAKSYLTAASKYKISEVYLTAHSALETGNGTSILANGVIVNGVKVYNMYGICAYDSDPIGYGSKYAYDMGWTTPEKAIEGGAKWISERYINNVSYKQNTLYKMRWNPESPGVHQYATDIGWAVKQTYSIKNMYDSFSKATLRFDIPVYK